MAGDYCELIAARVTGFGCFRDSGRVLIDDVTVLLAENENGKTTFLRALSWFTAQTPFDEEDRRVGGDAGVVDIVALEFRLSKAAVDSLAAGGYPAPPRLRITKRTDGTYAVRDEDGKPLLGPRQEHEAQFRTLRDELVKLLRAHQSPEPEVPLKDALVKELSSSTAMVELSPIVGRIPTDLPSTVAAPNAELMGALVDRLLAEAADANQYPRSALDAVWRFLPRMIYFDDQVDLVRDSVTYEAIRSDPAANRTMVNLAALAGVDLTAIASDGHARQRLSRSASQTLTTGASKYWQGDPISFHITFDESAAVVAIEHRNRDQKPSRRSRGLQWFLGFYVNFVAETEGALQGAVLLLDEPGIYLHVKQQPKLLELFDQIARENQIVYSTQMPYMVPRHRIGRLRLLMPEEKGSGAVAIKSSVHAVATSADVLQPLRAALGVGIADAMSLGELNLVVEGLSDLYLLDAMSRCCASLGLSSLNPDVRILPAGGAGRRMLPMVAFVAAEFVRGAVLVDDDRGGRDAEREIGKAFDSTIRVVRVRGDTGRHPSGDEIEDLVAPELYVALVNESHTHVAGYAPIEPAELDGTKSLVEAVGAVFRTRGYGDFQKMRPARALQARVAAGDEFSDEESAASFGELFQRIEVALAETPSEETDV